MKVPGLSRLRRLYRQVRGWWRSLHGAVILGYHRVIDFADLHLCVSSKHFQDHMDHISRYYTPIHLLEFFQRLQSGKVPKRAVIVTFDDGYADNLWIVKPILERYGVPATVFVTSGYVGRNEEFYWYELQHILMETEQIPTELCLSLNGQPFHWHIKNLAERNSAYWELSALLRSVPHKVREELLQQLREWAGISPCARPINRILSPEELVSLAQDGLVDIGAHTVTHPDLACLSPEEQRWEIEESRRQLEAILGRPVRSFAYPYGSGNATTRKLVQEAGFQLARATVDGIATKRSDPFWLPRFRVADWDGETFARKLRNAWGS